MRSIVPGQVRPLMPATVEEGAHTPEALRIEMIWADRQSGFFFPVIALIELLSLFLRMFGHIIDTSRTLHKA